MYRRHMVGLVAVSAAAGGCFATVYSSSVHLTPEQATTSLREPMQSASLDVVRAFAMRDISLVERMPTTGDDVLLRFSGGRRHAGGEDGSSERHTIDSIYYVRLEPTAGGTSVRMIGRPAVDGVEACTHDPGFALACSEVSPPEWIGYAIDGFEEAQVIRNMLVQLALEPRR